MLGFPQMQQYVTMGEMAKQYQQQQQQDWISSELMKNEKKPEKKVYFSASLIEAIFILLYLLAHILS